MSTNLEYIDIHGHINFSDYDADRETVIMNAKEAGVGIITVGTDVGSSKKAIELAETHENMWAVVGVHPTDAKNITDDDFSVLQELAKHPNVVAIGECGLDYFHGKPDEISRQREVFLKHIEIANHANKPLMLHVRNGKQTGLAYGLMNEKDSYNIKNNAYQETISILKQHSKVRANFHFFAGTVQDALDIVDMSNMISFTGVVTFTHDYDEIIRTVPLESIMSETDCPFVTPVPYRGKRNEPLYVIETVRRIADIRGQDFDVVAKQIIDNAKTFFGNLK